ncbi:hypothetical protein BSK49_10795 [Paenibacillus odorifer]|uniref:radical SAM/SPASM domain-containing protein n=1 Tax=Paenibacillus TaxID=44249 RepID=UPI00096E6CCE|nr:radical SAM/SPASM domain-containing protein [Paenibacillus odorifer]OMD89846.1 hypothetical protein BSK49_10795 [Paenibacillus odorifer]OMD95834.1 hypothetical protein BSK64_29490 [Paenibacillus odorifer]
MKVYQVEISNYCNLECVYCPHPHQTRKKGFMSFKTFKDAVELVIRCEQKEIYLHNFGEPLLHPDIILFINYSIEKGLIPNFFTNGVLLDLDTARKLYDAGLRHISISEHTNGEIDRIKALLVENSINIEITHFFRKSDKKHNWANQTKTKDKFAYSSSNNQSCIFERQNAFVILWNGKINTCCIDVNGIDENISIESILNGERYIFRPIALCSTCNLMRGEEVL